MLLNENIDIKYAGVPQDSKPRRPIMKSYNIDNKKGGGRLFTIKNNRECSVHTIHNNNNNNNSNSNNSNSNNKHLSYHL